MSGLIWIKLFGTLIEFLKELHDKVNFEKNQQMTKEHAKLPNMLKLPGGLDLFHQPIFALDSAVVNTQILLAHMEAS